MANGSRLAVRYDDCVLTCSIPFARRRRGRIDGDGVGTAAERWRSLAVDTDVTDEEMSTDVDDGLCKALAVTLFGSKLRCHRQKPRHAFKMFACLLAWCLTAHSAQIGYIVP